MRNSIPAVFAVIAFCLTSCEQNRNESDHITIQERLTYPESIIEHAFDSIRPAGQTFLINVENDTLISGNKGISIAISKGTFINAHG